MWYNTVDNSEIKKRTVCRLIASGQLDRYNRTNLVVLCSPCLESFLAITAIGNFQLAVEDNFSTALMPVLDIHTENLASNNGTN